MIIRPGTEACSGNRYVSVAFIQAVCHARASTDTGGRAWITSQA
jgi:hypothetical protein